jgi:DNA polymerase-3 subunit delta
MPTISYSALLKSLAKRPPGAVFFLFGEEDYLREEAAQRVVHAFLDPATRDFNFDQLRGADTPAEQLASLLATPPMMAEYRVVVLREAQGLSNKAREAVEDAARNPPAGLILVVAATIPSGSRAKFYSNLQSAATSVEFAAVDPMDLPGWLTEHAREAHGMELEIGAARALAAAIGSQLGVLASELDKLAAFAAGRPAITLDDVRAVGGYIPRVDRWAWFDLIGERRFEEALRLLPPLLESGESGVGLVIGATTQLLRVALAVAGGREALEKQLKPYQRWLANRVQPQARRWSQEEVDRALTELLRTDRLLKSASLNDRQAMEELLLRLADLPASRRSAA